MDKPFNSNDFVADMLAQLTVSEMIARAGKGLNASKATSITVASGAMPDVIANEGARYINEEIDRLLNEAMPDPIKGSLNSAGKTLADLCVISAEVVPVDGKDHEADLRITISRP